MIALRRAVLIRDWYPDPCALKNSKISASILKDVSTFVGAACGPRPRFRTGAPNMFSVHAGLSGSSTLAEVFFGNLAVLVCFMFFCLSLGSDGNPPLPHPLLSLPHSELAVMKNASG